MKNGTVYYKLDCLDVLETLEDNSISLIYIEMPYIIGAVSKRIMYDEKTTISISTFLNKNGCNFKDVLDEDIEVFFNKVKSERKKEYEKYLLKVAHNCYRVLKDNGVIVYREISVLSKYVDVKYILGNLFTMFGVKVFEQSFRYHVDLIYFFAKNSFRYFPMLEETQQLEQYPYKDKNGKYKLVSIVRERTKSNFFEWHGFYPEEGKGWIYTKTELEELDRKGYIVPMQDIEWNIFPKLKRYKKDEKPVRVPFSWNEETLFEKTFDLFTTKGDKVLGFYDPEGFCSFAEKKNLLWHIVIPPKTAKSSERYHDLAEWSLSRIDKKLNGHYKIVETLRNHKPGIYEKDILLMKELNAQRNEYYQGIVKEYELQERPSVKLGNTTDRILLYYIEEYEKREGIGDSEFERRSGVTRQTVSKIRNAAYMNTNPVNRDKFTILRIAVYTDMRFPEIRRALSLSGKAFDIENVADRTIIDWLYSDDRDIDELNDLIQTNCENANWTQAEIDKRLYLIKSEKKKAKKVVTK